MGNIGNKITGNKLTDMLPITYYPPRGCYKIEIRPSINHGRRQRRFFPTLREAEEYRARFVQSVLHGGIDSAIMDGLSVRDALRDFMDEKLPDASAAQVHALEVNERRILKAFGSMSLEILSGPAGLEYVMKWLRSQGWSKRTQFNAYAYLRTFLRWCHRRGKISENHLERIADEVTKPASPKVIITPDEMRLLLHLTRRNAMLRAFVVMGGFAGIRTDEIRKMRWEDLDWEGEEIHVPPHAIKKTEHRGGMRERYIKMLPAFIRHMPKGISGPIIPIHEKTFLRKRAELLPRMRRLMRRLGMPHIEKWHEWPDNCLRHTFASALLAVSKNAWMVAHEMGHTNAHTVKKDYARAMKEREAQRYFDL